MPASEHGNWNSFVRPATCALPSAVLRQYGYLHFQLPYKTPSRRKKSQPQYHKVIQGHLLPAFTIYEGDEQKDRQDLLGRY